MTNHSLTLPWPPSVNKAWCNVPGKGRVKTKAYKSWEEAAGWSLRSQSLAKITSPVTIFYTFGKKSGRFDLSNFIKPIEDLLVSLKVISDDNSKVIRDFHVSHNPNIDGVQVSIIANPDIGKGVMNG